MKSLLFSGFFLMVMTVIAQPGGSPMGNAPTPIDGGLTLLLAAGAAYGVKKVKDSRKKSDI